MAHNHSHSGATGNILSAFVLNLIFAVVELVGGVLTNSVAILSDALHDLGDCVSLGVAWGLQRRSERGRDARFSYGYKRYSLLGSLFLSGVLTVSSVVVLIEACKRIAAPQQVDAQGMLWLSIVGIVINGIAAIRLKRGSSLSERAVYLHILEDVLGWVGVLVVSVVMLFVYVPVLDPLLSVGISLWVLWNVYGNLKQTVRVILQGVPEGIDMEELRNSLLAVSGVDAVHDLHVWTQDGVSHVMTLHVVTSMSETLPIKEAVRVCAYGLHIEHVTIEFECAGEECVYENC